MGRKIQVRRGILKILLEEELYWQKRGGENWILKGDANTGFFHKCANGRRRKTEIKTLEDEGRCITDAMELRSHKVSTNSYLVQRRLQIFIWA